jgi:hypothetical protein
LSNYPGKGLRQVGLGLRSGRSTMRRTLVYLLLIAVLAAVMLSCSTSFKVPSPQELQKSNVARRYCFAPEIDQDRALRILADYTKAYEDYEESRTRCAEIDAAHGESERCEKEPDCRVAIAWKSSGKHKLGGTSVCVTSSPFEHQWSQEKDRRSCLRSSDGVWVVYQLTEDGKVYGGCDDKGEASVCSPP